MKHLLVQLVPSVFVFPMWLFVKSSLQLPFKYWKVMELFLLEDIPKNIKDGKCLETARLEWVMNSLVVLCTEGDWESDREEQDKLHNVFFDYRKAFYSILGAKLGRHGQGPSNTGYVEIGSLDGDQQDWGWWPAGLVCSTEEISLEGPYSCLQKLNGVIEKKKTYSIWKYVRQQT